jgi:tryptophan synthase alpha chain
VAAVSDAVVIGSRLIQLIESETRENAPLVAKAFMAEIRAALDA